MRYTLVPLLFALAGVGLAGTEIVLQDGKVIQVTDVRRDGDVYVLQMDSGGTITLPFSLVHEVRLVEDERPRRTPEGWTLAEPQQLAGEQVLPLSPTEAQQAIGEPARFRPNLIDPNWKPQSGFPDGDVLAGSRSKFRESIIDPSWKPQSGFPDGDVLAGSRSKFRESIIDPSWKPEDGFKRKQAAWDPEPATTAGGAHLSMTGARSLSQSEVPTRAGVEWARTLKEGGWFRQSASTGSTGVSFRFDAPPQRPSAKAASVKSCAAKIFRARDAEQASAVEAVKVDDARYANLPIDVFASTRGSDHETSRALFTVAGGRCRAISGDLRDVLGVKHSGRHTRAQALASYNAALADGVDIELETDEAKIDYAFAVASLVDPDVNGNQRASLLMVPDKSALGSLVERDADGCSLSASKRKKAVKQARKAFEPPQVRREDGGEMVELFAWSSAGGEFVRQTVELSEDGKVSIDREVIASHVGEHVDRD